MLSNYAFKINLRRHMCKRPWLQNNTLMQLNVGYNEIYNDGAWELAEAVGDNTGLQGLDLQRNEITDEGAAHVKGLLAANAVLREAGGSLRTGTPLTWILLILLLLFLSSPPTPPPPPPPLR